MEVNEKEYASKGVAGAGLGLGIAGTALALMYGGGCGGAGRGLFGNACGGGCPGPNPCAEKDAKIARLEAEKYTDGAVNAQRDRLAALNDRVIGEIVRLGERVSKIETSTPLLFDNVSQKIKCCCDAAEAGISSLQRTVARITKLVVPNEAVCPGWDRP